MTYSLIDTEPWMRKWLKLVDDKEFNPNFESLGYVSVYYAINLGPMLFLGFYQVLVLLLILITKAVSNDYIQKIRSKAKDSMMWGFVLTFLNEGYIVFALSCSMQYKFLEFNTRGTAFSSVLGLISGVILVALPITNLVLMIKLKDRFEDSKIEKKFGSLYE